MSVMTAAPALTATTASRPRLVARGRPAKGLVSNAGHAIRLVITARVVKRPKRRFAGARMTAASASGIRKGLRWSGAAAEASSALRPSSSLVPCWAEPVAAVETSAMSGVTPSSMLAGTNSDAAKPLGASDRTSVSRSSPRVSVRERRQWRARAVPSMTLPD
jgi:hypothetical protein